jgi:hypothetical protein
MTPHPLPPGVTLPQPGEVLTHEQAAFVAHLAGMQAKTSAEACTAPEQARDALLSASLPPTHGLQKFQLGMMWTMEIIAKLMPGGFNELDDFAITYLLYSDPQRTAALAKAGDIAAILEAAHEATAHLTVPECKAVMTHVAKEMEFFQTTKSAEEKKPSPAVGIAPLPSPEIDPREPMDGPSD